jgi:hypothetical protein
MPDACLHHFRILFFEWSGGGKGTLVCSLQMGDKWPLLIPAQPPIRQAAPAPNYQDLAESTSFPDAAIKHQMNYVVTP